MDRPDLLSCQRCTRLKTKCSREYPSCAQCLKHNANCIPVPRVRRPRGRNGGRSSEKAELCARIAHLEDLVKSIGEKVSGHSSPDQDDQSHDPSGHPHQPLDDSISNQQHLDAQHLRQSTGHHASAPLGQSLFVQLSEELVGIREILNDSTDNGTTALQEDSEVDEKIHHSSGLWFFPGSASRTTQTVPTNDETLFLMSVFRRRVHPLLKTVHLPALEREIRTTIIGRQAWSEDAQASAAHAAALFVAVASLSDLECRENLGSAQTELWTRWRACVEQKLANSCFLTSERLETLQTLIFYLVS